MGLVVFDITVSLDGFVTGPDDSPERPLGVGGEALHDWISAGRTDADTAVLDELFAAGAVVTGRRTYDNSEGEDGWGDGPLGTVPVFVLTHRPATREGRTPFTFVGDGPESAVAQARDTAGDGDVYVMSANVAGQVLRAGLLDAIRLHIAPVLLGGGVRLFDDPALAGAKLRAERVVQTPCATHLWYRVV
ncbi:dihydrofolate reductase family protein [Actinokineospora soli]|uniref:Dihydrofolate reductase family protein n=1 Tax=Actinokineospora soli TaxID=1048753 RepID=A0ABW2TJB1_9PSEU